MAVDCESGRVAWTRAAGGRIDSPPTVVGQRLYFGSADGTVTCLDVHEGRLQWRRRLAPRDERIVSDGRIESVWPVHGSVLYHHDLIYAVAGRSMFVDGGLTLFGLNPLTGQVVYEQKHTLSGEKIRGLDTIPAKPDVLSASGTTICMRSMAFDLECRKREAPVKHLFASHGFLNSDWFHRAFWTYSDKFAAGSGGTNVSGNRYHSGRMMVFDESHLYGFGRTRYGWGSAFQYKLYKADRPPAEALHPQEDRRSNADRGKGIVKQTDWSVDVPILVRSMVKAGDRLLIAGPEKIYDETEVIQELDAPEARNRVAAQAEAWEHAAQLVVVSASDGRIETAMPLGFAPVWDGMAVAEQELFVAGKDGSLYCLE